jgi:hypothetical protein
MGVKHGREYGEILKDLTEAIGQIPDSYLFFEMEGNEWQQLSLGEKQEVHEALAEDLFYGLGAEPVIEVGCGVVMYDKQQHRINLLIGEDELTVVPLI